jgi:HK97 family phage portal protein
MVRSQGTDGTGTLTDSQYTRLREEIDTQFSGAHAAGRPLLLEGGLEWQEMSTTPRDMDFVACKDSAARDIALALGVPPQLLGIPGDATYSNLAEARLALWEQTVLPLLDHVTERLEAGLGHYYGDTPALAYDSNAISALTPRHEALWARVHHSTVLTEAEKRQALGL